MMYHPIQVSNGFLQVLTSLDEARQAAFTREGLAKAKYNFRPQTAVELKLTKVLVCFKVS